ncbi:MAG: D-glycero-beta-D-manno-heptose 1-phosphate adenylyltransferase [Dialister sp.]|nr:D-glycero-beta-D-manno-heptose 1-phosphate adenylyltransferase [Dialister sp.]
MWKTGDVFLKEQVDNLHIAVIGDMMVDQYISGEVSRISPEAPVPVNKVCSNRSILGGAANTAANLKTLGCHVYVAGAYGDDINGRELIKLLGDSGIEYAGMQRVKGFRTTTKVRILGARQQMLRLDFEEPLPAAELDGPIMKWLDGLASKKLDCIVISDYGKGIAVPSLCQKLIQKGAALGIPVMIDPKGADWDKYRGAYGITPNLKELSECCHEIVPNEDDLVEKAARQILAAYDIRCLFVTRSEKGITAVTKDSCIHRASAAQDVFDVSGAGDTAMSVLAAASAVHMDTVTKLELANMASGIAVSKVGTYQVKKDELQAAWNQAGHNRSAVKTCSLGQLLAQIALWRQRKETIVFTNGCFDILHRGHVTYLRQAASLGAHLIIGLNSDESVKRLKGEERPILSERDRAFMLEALAFVDGVIIFSEDTPEKILSRIRPDVLVKGGDYKKEDVAGREYAGRVEILPLVKGYSTTNIIEKIKKLT